MKRILSILSIFILALTLVACGGSKEIDAVKENLPVLFEDPDNVISGFDLPTEFAHDVTGEWKSSDGDYLRVGEASDGVVSISVTRPNHDEDDKKVTLTVTLKKDKKKSDWSIDLRIKAATPPASITNSFGEAVTKENAGKSVVVTGVALYKPQGTNGYYLSTADGVIAFVHGTSGMPDAGKLYKINATVDNYYNSLQLKDVNYEEIDGTPDHEVTYEESSLKDITNPEKFPTPSKEHVYGHNTLKLKDVKVIVEGEGNYNTFLVDKDFDVEKDKRTKDNSVMIYYVSQIDEIRALEGVVIEEINLVLEGYRTDLNVWYFSYLLPMEDIKLEELTDEEVVDVSLSGLTIPKHIFFDTTISLPDEGLLGTIITWSTDKENIINLENGEVTAPNASEVVTLTATAKYGDVQEEKEFKINVGDLEVTTIKEFLEADRKPTRIKGVVTSLAPYNSFSVEDETGALAFRIGGSNSADEKLTFKVGDTINAIVEKNTFNGLIQGELFGGVEAIETVDVTEGSLKDLPEAIDLTNESLSNDDLVALQSHLVKLDEMLVLNKNVDKYDNIELTLQRVDGDTITLKWDARYDVDNNILSTIVKGDIIDLDGVTITVANRNALLMFDRNETVKKSENVSKNTKATFDLLTIADGLVFDKKDQTLPEKGTLTDVNIQYAFKDIDNTHNDLVDLDTLEVTLPEDDRVVVFVTATIGDITVDVELIIGEHVVKSIEYAYDQRLGFEVMVKGVITDEFDFNTFAITDDTGSIAIYSPNNKLEVGKEVTIIATRSSNYGLNQLTLVSLEKTSEDAIALPEATDITNKIGDNAELEGLQAKLVTVKDAEITEIETDKYGNVTIKLIVNEEEITLRYDSRVELGEDHDGLEGLEVGQTIDYVGVLGWNNSPRLGFGPNSTITIK